MGLGLGFGLSLGSGVRVRVRVKAFAAPGVTRREGVGRFMCEGIGWRMSLPNWLG